MGHIIRVQVISIKMPGATPGPSRPFPLAMGSSISRPSTSASQSLIPHPYRGGARPRYTVSRIGSRTTPSISSQRGSITRMATPAYSPGTTTASGRRSRAASSLGGSEGNQIICAVSEARGISPSVGVAFINVSTGEAVLSQICDNQSYIKTIHKLTVFEPSRVLIVATACPPNTKSSLCSTIEEELPGVLVVPLGRQYWSETAGLEFIQALAFKEDVEAIKVAIEGNFYATCSFSAVCPIGSGSRPVSVLKDAGHEIPRIGVFTQSRQPFPPNQISTF